MIAKYVWDEKTKLGQYRSYQSWDSLGEYRLRRKGRVNEIGFQVADTSATTSNYSVSHLIIAWALINTSQTFAQYPTFTYGLSVIYALSLIVRLAFECAIVSSRLYMPIQAYLESPPTIFTDYREFKIALAALSNPPTLLLCRACYLPPFTGCLSVSESPSSLPI